MNQNGLPFNPFLLRILPPLLILSILIGGLGVDRFYIGDTGLGIFKLLTCGGFGVWTIVDWFLIMGATREKNTNLLLSAI